LDISQLIQIVCFACGDSTFSMAAEFIYPTRGNFSLENNNQVINVFDTLFVQYSSTWRALNLTIFCLEGATSTQYEFLNVPGNPILASGIYKFGTIDAVGFDISQYPTKCSFKLTKYGDNDSALGGEEFWVTSNAATSTTYEPTPTATAAATTTTTQSVMTTGTVGIAASTSSGNPSQTDSPANTSSGLSAGAKAGIGIGAAAVSLLILALVFIIFRQRRKKTAQANGHGFQLENTAANTGVNPSEKVELPGDTYRVADPEMHSVPYHQQHDYQTSLSGRTELDGAEPNSPVRYELPP
jgi:hypothetical protein